MMQDDTETRPTTPEEPVVRDADQGLMNETQSPRKQMHVVQVIDREGNSTHEEVPGYSTNDAVRTAQNKHPEAATWGTEETPKPIPTAQGYNIPGRQNLSVGNPGPGRAYTKSDLDVINHEDGHGMVALNEGIDVKGELRHTHPILKKIGGRAAIEWDWKKLTDPATGKLKPEHVQGTVRALMGGIAADEIRGEARDMNPNFDPTKSGSDAFWGTKALRDAGVPEGYITRMLHGYLDEAKAYLTKPEVSGVIKENAGFREPGLSTQYHKSGDRMRSMHNEIQRRIQNGGEPTNNGTNDGENVRGNTENVPGGEGGTAQATVPGSGNTEPGRPAEPVGGDLAAQQALETPAEAAAQRIRDTWPKAAQDRDFAAGLREHTTGSPEHDQAIKDAGAIPAGVMFPGSDYAVKMFHDPQTGSTLGFSPNEPASADLVRQKMAESRAAFAKNSASGLSALGDK